jgi:glycosyltransferase involved in cell wall biosynthesis
MVKLSVVIITFNEERNIRRCLDSVQKVADEIVVVDSYSTDNTLKICSEYRLHLVQNVFMGHIEQKNFALQNATHDHIFSIDADEALSPELEKEILLLKENWNHNAYMFNRLTNYCGKWIRHGGWYPDKKLRLFKKHSGKWGGYNPHDRFILNDNSQTGYLKGDLLHYSYYSIEEHISQVNRFTTTGALSAYNSGRRSGLLSILFKPCVKFIRDYFLLLGILDGYYGFVISRISANATFLKYVKLYQLQKKSAVH